MVHLIQKLCNYCIYVPHLHTTGFTYVQHTPGVQSFKIVLSIHQFRCQCRFLFFHVNKVYWKTEVGKNTTTSIASNLICRNLNPNGVGLLIDLFIQCTGMQTVCWVRHRFGGEFLVVIAVSEHPMLMEDHKIRSPCCYHVGKCNVSVISRDLTAVTMLESSTFIYDYKTWLLLSC